VPGPNGVVTADHPLAASAGVRVLQQGGNAADATVAAQAVLHVVRPQMCGASGNGFFTIYDRASGKVYNLSATGAAPKGLDASRLSSADLSRGIKAGVVPGLFGGWIALLERFGTMSLAQVLAPAIDYAENGHPLEASVAREIHKLQSLFEKYPSSRKAFLPEGRAPRPGETFRMPDLANTFQKLVRAEQDALSRGASRPQAIRAAFDRFYRGDIAEEIVRFYKENGGDFTMEDFAAFQPRWPEPVRTTYRGYDVYTSPPTSRGGLELVMQLNLVEDVDLVALGRNSAELVHLLAEAIKVAKADVYHYVADPERFSVPVAALASKEYAAQRRALIDRTRPSPYPEPGVPPGAVEQNRKPQSKPPAGPGDTPPDGRAPEGSTATLSVADRWGNVIAATPTHGSFFGTGVVAGNTGLTLNNGTRVGSTAPDPDHVNFARGGQVPILNNAPVIILRDGQFCLAIGTPGGEGIGQTQFQAIVNVLDFGMDIQSAVEAPRFRLNGRPSFYRPGAAIQMQIEEPVGEATIRELRQKGWEVDVTPAFSMALGSMLGIVRDPETGAIYAGADPRRVGYAVGW
jgi:gamma-glutamyltranspeptidase/glutathione hydrolase